MSLAISHRSSSATYGIGRQWPPDYLPVDETHPLRPRDAYGLGKEMIERMARLFARRGGFTCVCLRPTLIVRPERWARNPAASAYDSRRARDLLGWEAADDWSQA